ncbi:MAG: DUF1631 family protein [Burkholderiaceae bacterium]
MVTDMDAQADLEERVLDENGNPMDKRRRFELLGDARELIVSRMSQVVSDALEKMANELIALSLEKTARAEQQVLLDAVAIIRGHRAEIETKFRRSFVDVFERRLFNRAPSAPAARTDALELELVGDDVIDDQLAIERVVRKARAKLDPDEVLGMRARLAALVERDWFEENVHPASPEAIFEALKQSIDGLTGAMEVKTALLDAFEPYVTSNLNTVYSNVNASLRSHRVLPRLRPRIAVNADGARRSSGNDSSGAGIDGGDPRGLAGAVPGNSAGHAAGNSTGAAAAAVPFDPMLAATFEQLAQQVSSGDAGARSSAARMLSDPTSFGVADLPLPMVEPPLLDALNAMQLDPTTGAEMPAGVLSRVGAQARDKGSAVDQLTVEIVSLVFDYIYNDARLPDAAKQQLLRLQVVAVKAALIDRSFFSRRQHPMRRLIDRVTEVCADPDAQVEPGSPLIVGLARIVDGLVSGFDRDLGVFEQAIRQIDALAAAEADRQSAHLRELREDAERLELMARAQEDARTEIAVRLDDDTPPFVRGFLLRWWSESMARAKVDGLVDGLDWDMALRLGEQLLWSVAPKSADDIGRLAGVLPKMINGLLRGLKVVNPPQDEREQFFNELLEWHTRAIRQAKENSAANRDKVVSNVRLRSDGSIQFRQINRVADVTPTVAIQYSLVDELVRGDLIDLRESPDDDPVRVKLAWVSPSRKLFALTRYPDIARSIARAEMIAMFDDGRAARADEAPTVDRAIEAVTDGESGGAVASRRKTPALEETA